jgi:hypothetical protein
MELSLSASFGPAVSAAVVVAGGASAGEVGALSSPAQAVPIIIRKSAEHIVSRDIGPSKGLSLDQCMPEASENPHGRRGGRGGVRADRLPREVAAVVAVLVR